MGTGVAGLGQSDEHLLELATKYGYGQPKNCAGALDRYFCRDACGGYFVAGFGGGHDDACDGGFGGRAAFLPAGT